MPHESFTKIEPFLKEPHDLMKIQLLFIQLLTVFKLSLKDFATYIECSLPKAVSATESFWGFILCPCKMKKTHITLKKCFPVEASLSVNFDKDEVEIASCDKFEWKFLTHLFISFLKVNQGKWGSSQVSQNVLFHKAGEMLEKFVCDEILKEEEDEAMSRSLKRFREHSEEIATAQKKIKVVENVVEKKERKRNFQSLAKAAIAFVVGEQKFASDEAKQRGKVFKGEVDEMKPLLSEICNLKNQQEMASLFGEEKTELTAQMQEALDKIFRLKAKLVSEARDFVNQLREEEEVRERQRKEEEVRERQRKEEEERQRRQEEQERRRRQVEEERQRRQAEEERARQEEENKKERERENEAILIEVAQQQEEEEGEINEIERFRNYYKKAVNTAAYYAYLADNFVPCLRNLSEYSNHELRHMLAQNRTAMASIEDILASRQRLEGNGFWHGPRFRERPTDFPDFDIALSKF